MRRLIQFAICFVVVLTAVNSVIAQDNAQVDGKETSVTITGSASSERARFTAPSSAIQIRLEVYNSGGAKVFEQEVRGGNFFDWNLQDGQSQPLTDGSYLCVVTIKTLSGKSIQKLGNMIVEAGSPKLQPVDKSRLTAQQAQSVGAVEEDSSLTIVRDDGPVTTTVTAHNGEDGQIVRGQGALSFRIGDFFRGTDTEQMRITPEGNLGIGITHPLVRLDVDGSVRASQGIVFPDGSIQYSAATKTYGAKSSLPAASLQSLQSKSGKKSSGGQEHIDAAGTGTLNFVPKWAETGGSGTLTNSSIFDNGSIGIGTTSPDSLINIQGAIPFLLGHLAVIRTTGSTNGAGLVMDATGSGNNNLSLSVNGSLKGGLSWDNARNFMGFVNIMYSQNDFALRMNSDGSLTYHDGVTSAERFRITKDGNVGVGTASPIGPLEVIASGINAVVSTSFGGGLGNIPGFVGRSARGTASSPSATLVGDYLGNLRGRGFGASAFMLASGAISIRAAENFSDTAQGTFITFETTPIGSTSAAAAERMRIDDSGNVGIGVTGPADKLQVFGDIRVGTSGSNGCIKGFDGTVLTGTCSSDVRFKRDITPFPSLLDNLVKLQPVHYFWRSKEYPDNHFGTGQSYGLIAQEVQKVLPELVEEDAQGYKMVNYSKLPLMAIQAIKELKAENDALRARLAALEQAMQQLMGQQQARQPDPQQSHR